MIPSPRWCLRPHPSQSHIRATGRWLADLGQHEAFTLGFRDRVPELSRRVNPQLDGFIRMRERLFLRGPPMVSLLAKLW